MPSLTKKAMGSITNRNNTIFFLLLLIKDPNFRSHSRIRFRDSYTKQMECRRDCRITLVALVLGLALGARLRAVLALVLVAGAAHRKPADVAGGEDVPLRRGAHAVAADLAHLSATAPPRLLHTHAHSGSRDSSVFLSQDPPAARIMQLRSPATHHAIRVALHGRQSRREPSRELAWSLGPGQSRHQSRDPSGTRINTASPAARALLLLVVVVAGRGLTIRGEEGREKRTGHRTDGGSRGNVSWFRCRCRREGLRIDKRLLQRRDGFDPS
jgi:hypothetical protein